jgi:CRISPR-associated exonuclease Cas4
VKGEQLSRKQAEMIMFDDDDLLLISGIQHFAFCRRRWALIYLEAIWDDNWRTIDGVIKHERVHNPNFTEKRVNTITTHDMPIFSRELGLSGHCDAVEFYQDDEGVRLAKRQGLWLPLPIEYKRGSPQKGDADRLQLCAQATCLEEMLACKPIEFAYMYYFETKRREKVLLDDAIRTQLRSIVTEMRGYYERQYTPRVKSKKACQSCSLKDLCLPKMPAQVSVQAYIDASLEGDSQ